MPHSPLEPGKYSPQALLGLRSNVFRYFPFPTRHSDSPPFFRILLCLIKGLSPKMMPCVKTFFKNKKNSLAHMLRIGYLITNMILGGILTLQNRNRPLHSRIMKAIFRVTTKIMTNIHRTCITKILSETADTFSCLQRNTVSANST